VQVVRVWGKELVALEAEEREMGVINGLSIGQ